MHNCPDCKRTCHCLEGDVAERNCTCCSEAENWNDETDEDDPDLDDEDTG